MISVVFYETQTRPEGGLVTVDKAWHTFELPAGATKTMNKAGDRLQYSFFPGAPVRIPTKAGFDVHFQGQEVFQWEYGCAAGIPALDPCDPPGSLAMLPDEKWVQLNPAEHDFVVQLKLQKVGPAAGALDPGTGEAYVYGVARIVVQVSLPRALAEALKTNAAPTTDKDRALQI